MFYRQLALTVLFSYCITRLIAQNDTTGISMQVLCLGSNLSASTKSSLFHKMVQSGKEEKIKPVALEDWLSYTLRLEIFSKDFVEGLESFEVYEVKCIHELSLPEQKPEQIYTYAFELFTNSLEQDINQFINSDSVCFRIKAGTQAKISQFAIAHCGQILSNLLQIETSSNYSRPKSQHASIVKRVVNLGKSAIEQCKLKEILDRNMILFERTRSSKMFETAKTYLNNKQALGVIDAFSWCTIPSESQLEFEKIIEETKSILKYPKEKEEFAKFIERKANIEMDKAYILQKILSNDLYK